ncbi:MAG TPA: peptidylprolyl isomerase [Flavobacteriaceae bacterium]|nr:peptidylprolyl isomerase [Flavobacteriaceae bacterium]
MHHKNWFFILALFFQFSAYAQEMGVIDTTGTVKLSEKEIPALKQKEKEPMREATRYKVEGISAVVGSYMVLDSDIDKALLEMEYSGVSLEGVTRCDLLGKLMEDKLYAHHAIVDSLQIDEERIRSYMNQQIEQMVEQMGSEDALVEFYRKESMDALRNELFEHHKSNELANMMQSSVVENIEVTPEEVRQFFYNIPKDDRPYISTEVELAQIVFEPKISEENKQSVIDRLNEMREDVLEGNSSFSTLAVLYSKDHGSRQNGGKLPSMRRDSPYAKELKDHAFSLRKEGDISEPFETDFGFHIVYLDKIRGQEIEIRHILLYPNVSQSAIEEARQLADSVRTEISNGTISFADAARKYSDEKETRTNGGQLFNPHNLDTRFDLTKLDSELHSQVYNLKEGEISPVIIDQDQFGKSLYKIIKVTKRIEEHPADYQLDFVKIKDLALQQKQIRELRKWRKEKVKETYIHINADYENCKLEKDWLSSLK